MRDQIRSFDFRSWKAPAICEAVQRAAFPHHAFQERDLAVVDEELQFARFAEIGLGSEQRHCPEAVVADLGHGGGGERQQRAAEAIAGGVDLLVRHD